MAVRVARQQDARDAFREPKRGVRHRFDYVLGVVLLLSNTCVYLYAEPLFVRNRGKKVWSVVTIAHATSIIECY
jgi:hypothetical protein